jgi:hypothetical protein
MPTPIAWLPVSQHREQSVASPARAKELMETVSSALGRALTCCFSAPQFLWQDGKRVIVWPEDLAPGKPRFPTPPWRERR